MLGKVLRDVREKAGLSQETVAARARIGRSYLSQLENDAKSPTVKTFVRVCRAIGVLPSEVLRKLEK